MSRVFTTFLALSTVCLALSVSCLRPNRNGEDPFAQGSLSNPANIYAMAERVGVTGFIDPELYSSIFASGVDLELGLTQQVTGVEAFIYALHTTDDGFYDHIALGTANVNSSGFFYTEVPEGVPIYVSIGHPLGERQRMIFNAPMKSDLESGAVEDSILVEQTKAMNYASSIILQEMENSPDFHEQVLKGLDLSSIQMAGAIYEQSLEDENIESWEDEDIEIFVSSLIQALKDQNNLLHEASKDPIDLYAKGSHASFSYPEIFASINAREVMDLAVRFLYGQDRVREELASAGLTTIEPNLTQTAIKNLPLGEMKKPLLVAKSAVKAQVLSEARRQFSAEEYEAIKVGVDVSLEAISTVSAARNTLQGYYEKPAESNPFRAIQDAARKGDVEETYTSVFSGMTDQQKGEFRNRYNGNINPDNYQPSSVNNRKDILMSKCSAWGGSPNEVMPSPTGANGTAVIRCEFTTSSCSTRMYDTLFKDDLFLFGYEFYGLSSYVSDQGSEVQACKAGNFGSSNVQYTDAEKQVFRMDSDSLFLDQNECLLMGAHWLATTGSTYCYFPIIIQGLQY